MCKEASAGTGRRFGLAHLPPAWSAPSRWATRCCVDVSYHRDCGLYNPAPVSRDEGDDHEVSVAVKNVESQEDEREGTASDLRTVNKRPRRA
jgi:hypothetical protein